MSDRTSKKADIIAVAKAARVSPSTVSRSFNHPAMVKPDTRRRIDAAIRRLGYIRNRAAQTIHGRRSGTVGLIVPTVDQAIFAELIQSFSEAVEDLGFTILLATHGYDLDREYAVTRKMLEHRVDGLALIGLDHSEDTYGLIAQQAVPALLLWNHAEGTRLPCIGSDNRAAGALIGRHLTALGHRRVAAIFPPLAGNDRAGHRFDGLQSALRDPIPERWRRAAPYSVAAAARAVAEILETGRPTAIACGNDVLAWGALHALARRGLRVPEDVTVTGIGDFNGSADFEPPLTTVRIPARAIGARAAQAIATLVTESAEAPVAARLAAELRIRATCRPPAPMPPDARAGG